MTKHPVDVHVGGKIRHRRWLVGMTQQGLATACAIKFQQIQKYESGANRVACSRLWDMANALGVPVSYFFEGLEGGAPERMEPSAPEPSKAVTELAGRIDRLPQRIGRAITALVEALESDNDANG